MSGTAIIQSKKIMVFLLVSFILTSTVSASIFNTNYGTLSVKSISIMDDSIKLSGTLYKPIKASENNIMPAVICLHGFMNAKTTLSGVALELARRDFVTLALDAVGHGNSQGGLGGDDPTLGLLAAINYVRSLNYVNSSSIGLVGHSMGAAAVRAAAFIDKNISATVLIGGGVSTLGETGYGSLNSTFPKNLLIAIGRYDQFFPDLANLKKELKPIFGLSDEQELTENYAYYGSFDNDNARRLVISNTIHFFEPVDNKIVSEIVSWMHNSLKSPDTEITISFNDQIYLYREFLMLLTTVAVSILIILLSVFLYDSIFIHDQKQTIETSFEGLKPMEWYKVALIWGSLSLALFLPLSLIGGIINFPPIIFGSSLSFWILGVAISGIMVFLYFNPAVLNPKVNTKSIMEYLRKNDVFRALSFSLVVFLLLYIFAGLYESVFRIDLHFVIPLLNDLVPINRVIIFLLFIPFFIIYFYVENLYFNVVFDGTKEYESFTQKITLLLKQMAAKTIPYLAIILIVYFPSVLFGVHLIQGTMFPLIVQILWVIIPLFWVFSVISWWFFESTSSIETGVILNSLLISWFLAS
ncbi:MAG: alpha/beta hydrolase, partial [Candidatus Hodarchaeales archaeon]